MFIEDNFRKTYNVDLMRIIGEKIHKGLLYYEQGEELFQKVNMHNYTSPALNLNNDQSLKQVIGKSNRQINEIKCYTQSQIVYQNKLRRDLMTSQKMFRRPDLIRVHSQQALRNAKTATPKLQQRTEQKQSINRYNHKSHDNVFSQKLSSNGIIEFERLKTPQTVTNYEDFSRSESNFFSSAYKSRNDLFSQNQQRKKQGQFNMIQSAMKQDQQGMNVEQMLNLQQGKFGMTHKNQNLSFSNQNGEPFGKQQKFNLIYHDNSDIRFQNIVPFANQIFQQPKLEPITDREYNQENEEDTQQ